MIAISPSCCPGDPGCSASVPSNTGLKSQTPAEPASGSSSGTGENVAVKEKVAGSLFSPLKGGKSVVDDSDPCPEL